MATDQSFSLPRKAVPVFVATTVMLSFISFWRAAAIVLSDLASSAYYAGGEAERVIGKSAPWFILAVMLFSYAVRALYIESSSMFVRGGVYRVVKEAMGGTLAKFSVAALLFDYVLTGPISAASAGQYLAGFVKDIAGYLGHPLAFNDNYFAAVVAIFITLYFWRKNIQGIHESSDKAMKIMKTTTVMVVILIAWCVYTLLRHPAPLPPLPSHQQMLQDMSVRGALGWLHGGWLAQITLVLVLVGFGHSVLAMSGEETLAQVNREIESPKLKNLERTGFVIFIYSLLFTSLVSFFGVMIIPDSVRPQFYENLIGGLAMYLHGPLLARLVFHGFVVLVGALILSGAVNTSIVGANGVMNRIAEDGVLPSWFQRPQKTYGTSYRLLNLIVGLQLLTIVVSRGSVDLLAALYAFGVVWSFAFKALAVLVLRYKMPEGREWKVPGNLRIGRSELPLGLSLITLVLFLVAVANLLTKKDATIAGVTFSLFFFALFEISERVTLRREQHKKGETLEQFRVFASPQLNDETITVRPGNVLVSVRDPNNLYYLKQTLVETDTAHRDVVVMTARLYHRMHSFSGSTVFEAADVFDDYEQELFSRVVAVAEKEGKPVKLLVVPGNNAFDATVMTAQKLRSDRIVCGLSHKLTADEQGKLAGDAWERLPQPRPTLQLNVMMPDGEARLYELGPHAPRLREQDIKLLHELWLQISSDRRYSGLHHYHLVALALSELKKSLKGPRRDELLGDLRRQLEKGQDQPPPPPAN